MEEDEEGCRDTIFILENRSHLGYKRDLMQNCEGLDYEHSVLGKWREGRDKDVRPITQTE